MSLPKLVSLAREIETLLAKYLAGQEKKYLLALLFTILEARIDEGLESLAAAGSMRGLKSKLRLLQRLLQNESNLHKALAAHYLYELPTNKAKARWNVTATEWSYIRDLAARAGESLDKLYVYYMQASLSDFAWHDELEEEFTQQIVVLEQKAIEDLVIPVMEGYLSPRKIKGRRIKGYEVYGICLGMRHEPEEKRKGHGWKTHSFINIMRCQPQLSAEATASMVLPSKQSISALMKATKSLFPSYELIGEWHSHPYKSVAELIEDKGWEFSDPDKKDLPNWARQMRSKELVQDPATSLVIAIAASDRPIERGHYNGIPSTLEFSVGGCRLVINAYRILGSGRHSANNVIMKAPGMID